MFNRTAPVTTPSGQDDILIEIYHRFKAELLKQLTKPEDYQFINASLLKDDFTAYKDKFPSIVTIKEYLVKKPEHKSIIQSAFLRVLDNLLSNKKMFNEYFNQNLFSFCELFPELGKIAVTKILSSEVHFSEITTTLSGFCDFAQVLTLPGFSEQIMQASLTDTNLFKRLLTKHDNRDAVTKLIYLCRKSPAYKDRLIEAALKNEEIVEALAFCVCVFCETFPEHGSRFIKKITDNPRCLSSAYSNDRTFAFPNFIKTFPLLKEQLLSAVLKNSDLLNVFFGRQCNYTYDLISLLTCFRSDDKKIIDAVLNDERILRKLFAIPEIFQQHYPYLQEKAKKQLLYFDKKAQDAQKEKDRFGLVLFKPSVVDAFEKERLEKLQEARLAELKQDKEKFVEWEKARLHELSEDKSEFSVVENTETGINVHESESDNDEWENLSSPRP